MKCVLVLAYYFPPLGGAGVQRTVKFVKHLRALGYEAIVVTGSESAGVDWAPPDPVLSVELPSNLRILRGGIPPRSSRTRLRRWLRLPTPFERWWRSEATRLGRTVLRDVDLIYASMSPFETARVASVLSKESGRPWVADLRDPWALDDWLVYASGAHRALEKRRMRRELASAAAIIMNTAEARHALVESFPDLESRSLTIPNGWDREDFQQPAPARTDGLFRIVYSGYTHVAAGRRHRARGRVATALGGAVDGLDVLARSHYFLVQAMERLARHDPELAARTELHIAGAAPPEPLGGEADDRVRHYGYLTHDRALELIRSSDALFLPMQDLPPGVRTRTVPGKTYEYLASGRPILAAVPDGDARDLLAGEENVWLCRPTDVEAMTAALQEIARRHPPTIPAREAIELCERHRLAARLAAVFDQVLESARDQ